MKLILQKTLVDSLHERANAPVTLSPVMAIIAGTLALTLCWGCRQASDEPGELSVALLAKLSSCSADERVWEAAIEQAKAQRQHERLREVAEEAAAACPERWQPWWAAGESVLLRNPALPRDVAAAAQPLFEQSLNLAEAGRDLAGVARAANRLAICVGKTAEHQAAEPLLRKAISAATDADRKDLAGFAYSNLADVFRRRGEFANALDALATASANLSQGGRTDLAIKVSFNRAVLLGDVGQLSERQKLLEQIHRDAAQAGAAEELPRIRLGLGNLYLALNEPETARKWFDSVPADHALSPYTALGLGRLALREGRYEEAARQLERASAQQLDPGLSLYARVYGAEVDLRAGRPERARQSLAALIGEPERLSVKDVTWLARTLYGKLLVGDDSSHEEAVRVFREAVAAVEATAEGLNPNAEGMTHLRDRSEPFAELAASLAQRPGSDVDPILEVVERAHARALRQILGRATTEGLSIPHLDELAQRLREGEVLLDFLIGEDRGVVIGVTPHASRVAVLPGWSQLRPQVGRYLAVLKRPLVSAEARLDPEADLQRDVELGHQLRRQLLGPMETLLRGARRVYFVPDQDLALLPLGALPQERVGSSAATRSVQFLVDDLEFAVLPLAGLPTAGVRGAAPLLLAGNPLPDAEGEFGLLPLAGQELAGIEAVWQGAELVRLEGKALAAKQLRVLPLETYRTLHFATHAVASSRDPKRCAVILSAGERLGMQEIADLTLGPALVVLSACRTGEGEVIPGEGVVGLTWAFLRAGARGVLASLWSVEDASTTQLMLLLHRRLRSGDDAVGALAEAQRELARSHRHPAYWAPFIAVLNPARSGPAPQEHR